jgi:hypothetical protein
MGWNYVATFSGTWSIANFPTGAVDESGMLWVMYGDAGQDQALTYFSHTLPQNGTLFPINTTTRLTHRTMGSPCLMPVDGKLVAVWPADHHNSSNPQWWGVLDPETRSLPKTPIHCSPDGGLAAFFPKTDCLFIAYRGPFSGAPIPDEVHLFYGTVTGLDTPKPQTSDWKFLRAGWTHFESSYSPAVAAMPNGEIAVLFKGVGTPGAADSDDKLYFTSAPDPLNPTFPVPKPVQYPGPGGTSVTATSMNRPSLALHGTGKAATLVALYPGTAAGQLSYLVGTLNGGGVKWAAASQSGTVPLDGVLAKAGPGESAVKLTNPMGVWVTAPAASDTLYLLVGDQVDGTIKGPLYVVRYTGDDS